MNECPLCWLLHEEFVRQGCVNPRRGQPGCFAENKEVVITKVALDNLTLSTEVEIDPKALLALGEVLNAQLEAKRDAFAKAFSDAAIFGEGSILL